MKNSIILLSGFFILILSSCQIKRVDTAFSSERHYRHALFRGGYETLIFKPAGQVYVQMLLNGKELKANGIYKRHNKMITITLPTSPRRNFSFVEPTDNELLDTTRNRRWHKI